MKQRSIPCVFMRGGTSRGPYFLASDLPADPKVRDRVLLRVMGSPDVRQIDGLGGATNVTSKVAIVSPSDRPDAQVDYLFAQVDIEREIVDTGPTCGNMMSGVGPFAIEHGLVEADTVTTTLVVHNVNTTSLIDVVVQTPGGQVDYDGDCAIDGVPGTAAPISMQLRNIAGAKTGSMLPTGHVVDTIDGVDVTCIDIAMPMVFAQASALDLSGYESPAELDQNLPFMQRMQAIRIEAGRRMGLGDVRESVMPKFALVAPPRNDGVVTSRYFTPWQCHPTYAVSGSICVSSAAVLPGSVVNQVSDCGGIDVPSPVVIEHPAGSIAVALDASIDGDELLVRSGGSLRTARPIMAGVVYIPADIWP